MLKIKKLYGFMLQGFLPLFMMTFCICLFIVLMQFLWRFIDDLVGKGLEISVIAELFFYAALTMVPLALPLSMYLERSSCSAALVEMVSMIYPLCLRWMQCPPNRGAGG